MKFLLEYTAARYFNNADDDDSTPDDEPQEPFEIEAGSLNEAEQKANEIIDEWNRDDAKANDRSTPNSYLWYKFTKVSPLAG